MLSRRSRSERRTTSLPTTADPRAIDSQEKHRDDGAFTAMDQIANWVRFADAKSAILAAALGVVLTAFLNALGPLIVVVKAGGSCAWAAGAFVLLALVSFGYTLVWLFRALAPRRRAAQSGINRFAWPTLGEASLEDVQTHVEDAEARVDAWRQVVDLSAVANQKFRAFDLALRGFAACVITVLLLVGLGIALAS